MRLRLALDAQRPRVCCSPTHVRKALHNLLLNAIEASDEGGEVMVSTKDRGIEVEEAEGLGLTPGAHLVISVRDDGPGISPEDLERVFEPFYTKKRLGRSGTGIGLTVVWNTMQDHGGAVASRSAAGETVFDLFFPGGDASEDACEGEQPTSPLPRGRGERVLVVDDEPALRRIAEQMLRRLGYDASTAASGEEALRSLEETPADLLVLDMLMEPGINGRDTYERAREMNPQQRAIIASGFAATELVEEALALGARTFIKKPYTMSALALAVRDALESSEGPQGS